MAANEPNDCHPLVNTPLGQNYQHISLCTDHSRVSFEPTVSPIRSLPMRSSKCHDLVLCNHSLPASILDYIRGTKFGKECFSQFNKIGPYDKEQDKS